MAILSLQMVDIFGFMAAICTAGSFIPQAIKTIRTRNTEGISLLMYIIFSTGVGCWLIYGIMLNYLPMIVANSVTLVLTFTILTIKIISPSKPEK